MKDWKEIEKEFNDKFRAKHHYDELLCKPRLEVLEFIKQLQIKHIDEKIELWESVKEDLVGYDEAEHEIKYLQNQKSILESND